MMFNTTLNSFLKSYKKLITFYVEVLGNLLLKVCCKVELKNGYSVGIVDSLIFFIFFIASINLQTFSFYPFWFSHYLPELFLSFIIFSHHSLDFHFLPLSHPSLLPPIIV
jgi:hypothetical protein